MRDGGEAERQEEAAALSAARAWDFSPLSLFLLGMAERDRPKREQSAPDSAFPLVFLARVVLTLTLTLTIHHPSSIHHGGCR